MGEYLRDYRSPIPKSDVVSRVMSANRHKNTSLELKFRKALVAAGLVGYRLHWKKAPGKPDIAYPAKKVAIEVRGCYWHHCPKCKMPLPKHNREYWKEKFRKNRTRDKRNGRLLREEGWKLYVIWECELEKRLRRLVSSVRASLARRTSR